MKIDYVIPTYNSASLLDKCLTAIKKYGNPNNIIIIDNFSKDKTIEIAKKYDCKIVQTNATLGECRLIGAENAETRWISFIDSDVIINVNWKNIFKYINIKSAGAIQADPKDVGKDVSAFKCESPYNLKKLQRGFTGATVIRKDIIKDADIKDCNAFEDWFLTQHIIKKGYSWIVVPIIVDHYSSEEGLYYKKRMWHSSALRYYYKNKKIDFFVFTYLFLRYFLWYLKIGEFKSMFYFLFGIIKPEYFVMSRKSNKKKGDKMNNIRNDFVSVVIPTYNRPDALINLLKSLEDQTFKNFEVIAIASDDKTVNIAKSYKKNCPYPLEIDAMPNSREMTARNKGISLAKATIIAFTDDDCIPDNDWLTNGVKYFKNSNVEGIEGVIYSNERGNIVHRTPQILKPSNFVHGRTANMFYRKQILEKVNGFDERFAITTPRGKIGHRGDTDLAWRVQNYGEIPFASDVKVFHPLRKTTLKNVIKDTKSHMLTSLLLKKHPDRAKDVLYLTLFPITTTSPLKIFWFLRGLIKGI
jgi:glycosyltransferase involved in cell wall biosynthesis